MSPVVERREHSHRHSPEMSDLRIRSHLPVGRRSPPRARSPNRRNSSSRGRSPEKLPDRYRSPKQLRTRSSSSSRSPRTKRLRRAQAERETHKIEEKDYIKKPSREVHEKGRHRERGEGRDSSRDDESLRSLRRDAIVPIERKYSRRYGSRSPVMASKPSAREEISLSRGSEQYRNDDYDSIDKMKVAEEALEAKEKEKQKPSFELSGKLAEETNRVRGITILFSEPKDACKPDIRWRLYVFKAGEALNEPLYVHRQSCYLFGRERRVADIPTDHPSCSKQHAVLQYRSADKELDGLMSNQVRPYLMDLGSTNGTFINENQIEPQRYYELFEKDTIKFGNSSREYVMLHENSTG